MVNTGTKQHKNSSLWLYGKHVVMAALANRRRTIECCLATPQAAALLKTKWDQYPNMPPWVPPETSDRHALDRLLGAGTTHQGVAIRTRPLTHPDWTTHLTTWREAHRACVILLDQVNDPRHVGSILRSAAVFGADAVIVTDRHAPRESAALAKAASGALESVPLLRNTSLARTLRDLKDNGFWCIGLDAAATDDIERARNHTKCALVLGAEGRGLRRLTRRSCDGLARLGAPSNDPPPHDPVFVDSLSVATAAGIALYAITRPTS